MPLGIIPLGGQGEHIAGGSKHEAVKNLRAKPVRRVLEGLNRNAVRGGKQESAKGNDQRQGQHAAKGRGFLIGCGSQGNHRQHRRGKPWQQRRLIGQPQQHRGQHSNRQGGVGPDAAGSDGIAAKRHGHSQQQGCFPADHGDGCFQAAEMEGDRTENLRQRFHAAQEKQPRHRHTGKRRTEDQMGETPAGTQGQRGCQPQQHCRGENPLAKQPHAAKHGEQQPQPQQKRQDAVPEDFPHAVFSFLSKVSLTQEWG